MSQADAPLLVTQFTDILCVWAYVGQVRVDRLSESLGGQMKIDARFCPVFNNARERLERSWKDRGGLAGYAKHVADVVARFDHVELSPKPWASVAPNSSLNGHIFLAAIRNLEHHQEVADNAYNDACWAFREAFFRDGRDIGTRAVHYEIAEDLGLPIASIEQRLGSGAAHADLAFDFDQAREFDVRTSPTLMMNEGRQRLVGNVGYRVVEANVRELLRQPGGTEASWC